MDRPTRGYFCRCSRNQISAGIVGLRAGECRGLRWPDVDLDTGRITITGNATRSLDGLQVVTAPKTKAGNRTLILPQLCIEALRRTPRNGDLIWPGPGGSPWSASSFNSAWKSFCRRNGIRTVTYHALRHTAATLALQAGHRPTWSRSCSGMPT